MNNKSLFYSLFLIFTFNMHYIQPAPTEGADIHTPEAQPHDPDPMDGETHDLLEEHERLDDELKEHRKKAREVTAKEMRGEELTDDDEGILLDYHKKAEEIRPKKEAIKKKLQSKIIDTSQMTDAFEKAAADYHNLRVGKAVDIGQGQTMSNLHTDRSLVGLYGKGPFTREEIEKGYKKSMRDLDAHFKRSLSPEEFEARQRATTKARDYLLKKYEFESEGKVKKALRKATDFFREKGDKIGKKIGKTKVGKAISDKFDSVKKWRKGKATKFKEVKSLIKERNKIKKEGRQLKRDAEAAANARSTMGDEEYNKLVENLKDRLHSHKQDIANLRKRAYKFKAKYDPK